MKITVLPRERTAEERRLYEMLEDLHWEYMERAKTITDRLAEIEAMHPRKYAVVPDENDTQPDAARPAAQPDGG